MGYFKNILRSNTTTLSNPAEWFLNLVGGYSSNAGIRVNEEKAIQIMAVFSCIRLLSQNIAALPLHLYENKKNGNYKAYNVPLYNVLHKLANPRLTSYQFRIIMNFNLFLTGDAFAEIVTNNGGQVVELWPIPTNRVTIYKNTKTGETYYKIRCKNSEDKIIYEDRMLHIPFLQKEMLKSFKPCIIAREAMGLSLALEEFGARFFSNGSNLGGIVEYPKKMTDKAYDRYKDSFTSKYTGLGKSNRLVFLEEGLKFTKINTPPNEAQFLESRKFQVIEIARFYGVQPHKIMDLEKSSFNNIEEQNIDFVQSTLMPPLVCWEQEIYKSLLLTENQRKKYFAKFNVNGLLRGDTETRFNAYAKGKQWGFYSTNDIRDLEDLNPVEGGDRYYMPLNMMDIEDISLNQTRDIKKKIQIRKGLIVQRRSAAARIRAVDKYKPIFKRSIEKVLKKEIKDIREEAEKELRDTRDFLSYLDDYFNKDFKELIINNLSASFRSLAELIHKEAGEEVDFEQSFEELDNFLDSCIETYAKRHMNSSKNQLKKLITDAQASGTDAAEVIEQRLDEWKVDRAEKEADNETVKINGAISRAVYLAAGISLLRWVKVGPKPCKYCDNMDGVIISIDDNFFNKGDVYEPDGADSMNINGSIKHPPLHRGCQCVIVAER